MDNIYNILYDLYTDVLFDLNIGHPLSEKKLDRIWEVIHDLYFIQNDYQNPKVINYLLEHYEHV